MIFDHRGHGASDAPTDLDAYSFDRLRADTLAIADAAGLDHFRLLGHSLGGMLVRRIAVDRPDRVRALVMMDTSPGPIPGFDPELVELGVGVAINEGKDALKALLDMTTPLDTPRTSACSKSVPVTRSSATGSGTTCRTSCGPRSPGRSRCSPMISTRCDRSRCLCS